MSTSRYLWLAVASVLATGWAGTAESARRKAEPTLGSLAGRSAPVDRSKPGDRELGFRFEASQGSSTSSVDLLVYRIKGAGAANFVLDSYLKGKEAEIMEV